MRTCVVCLLKAPARTHEIWTRPTHRYTPPHIGLIVLQRTRVRATAGGCLRQVLLRNARQEVLDGLGRWRQAGRVLWRRLCTHIHTHAPGYARASLFARVCARASVLNVHVCKPCLRAMCAPANLPAYLCAKARATKQEPPVTACASAQGTLHYQRICIAALWPGPPHAPHHPAFLSK